MNYQKNVVLLFMNCCLIYFTVLAPSCNRPDQSDQTDMDKQEAFHHALTTATFYEYKNPDSALIFASRALELMQHLRFKSNDTLYLLLELKSNILSQSNQLDSAIFWQQKQYDICLASGDSLAMANSLYQLLRMKIKSGTNDNPIDQIIRLATTFDGLGKKWEMARTLALANEWFLKTGEVNKSQQYLIEASRIFENIDSLKALSQVYLDIGNNFKLINSNKEALNYYQKSAAIAESRNDTANLANALNNTATIYRKTFPDTAIIIYEGLIKLLAAKRFANFSLIVTFNLANTHLDRGDYNKAKQMFEQVMNVSRESGNPEGMAYAHNGLAAVFSKTGNKALAISNMEASVKIADSLNDHRMILALKRQLFSVYKEGGRWQDATQIADEMAKMNDSLMAIDKQIAIHELEIDYQTQKKELENTFLKEKVNNQEQILSLRQFIIIMLSAGLLVLTILLWFTFRLYKQRRYAYQALLANYKKEMSQSRQTIQYYNSKQDADSAISDPIADSDQLMERLLEYFNAEKPFLDHKIKVDEVALKLNTTRKAISLALKQYQNINFNTFCNLYRVEEAKQLLTNPAFDKLKIEAIGKDAGFGSRQSFYAVFQHITGMLPSYFRENLRSEGNQKV
jgi:AraC-like DNA-binding protein